MHYAEVIIPLPLDAVFTYSIPDTLRPAVKSGTRVIVPFGRRKFYTGIVVNPMAPEPKGFEVKDIERVLDSPDLPCLLHPQLKFWQWLADYYLSPIGDVMKAALPAGLKLESETFVELSADAELDGSDLSDEEAIMLQALAHYGRLSLGELAGKTGLTEAPEKHLAGLLARSLVSISEKVTERYRPLTQTVVCLPTESRTADWRSSAFAMVKGSPKQEHVLLALLQLAGKGLEADKAMLLEKSGCSSAVLKALADKGVVSIVKRKVNRFAPKTGAELAPLPTLSPAQQSAHNAITSSWTDGQKAVTLLRGVTSSGKTEIYIHLIHKAMLERKQVLFLVPEIALTTQLTGRLQRVFGNSVIVYHSKFTDNERVDIWNRLRNSTGPCVVIGARSSVFLPFHNLGLVIVDEEHEPSYKQFDPAPRYNARDCAIVLASMHGAKTLLGSASPSVESYYKASTGRYGLVELTERYGGVKMPEIEVIDMRKQWRKYAPDILFAPTVKEHIEQTLSNGKQAIVFHNRRGFAPMARCSKCAYVPKCQNCDVSLTYHKYEHNLQCHYCGATYPLPSICPVCHEPEIEVIGFGTEKVEEEVQAQFPKARIMRMDLDTTRNKDGYQEIINTFSEGKADILVGTQMVTKGLDFDGVDIVAVLRADTLINLPDFRAAERAFNMLLQVAGRAGRRQLPGKVMVQTSQPDHPVIQNLLTHNYSGFYQYELAERREHLYPPFTRMIIIYLRHREEPTLQVAAEQYGARLRALLGNRVAGPDKPAVARIRDLHIRRFMLKIESDASPAKAKQILRKLQEDLRSTEPIFKSVMFHYDVDPA